MGELTPQAAAPARALLARLDAQGGPAEPLELRWNPSSYRLTRAAAPGEGARDGAERLATELFLDTTAESGEDRDARRTVERLRRWMDLHPESLLPARVLFLWGPLRFVGSIEELEEEWVRFDPDGTPVRGRVRLSLRG